MTNIDMAKYLHGLGHWVEFDSYYETYCNEKVTELALDYGYVFNEENCIWEL